MGQREEGRGKGGKHTEEEKLTKNEGRKLGSGEERRRGKFKKTKNTKETQSKE